MRSSSPGPISTGTFFSSRAPRRSVPFVEPRSTNVTRSESNCTTPWHVDT